LLVSSTTKATRTAKQAVELSKDDPERARCQNLVKVMEARLKQVENQN
jgi:hypothetical protein